MHRLSAVQRLRTPPVKDMAVDYVQVGKVR